MEQIHLVVIHPACIPVLKAIVFLQWEDQHGGLTCKQFAAWKKDNDPEPQAQGFTAYLNEEGIGKMKNWLYTIITNNSTITDCPACKFKYALAKGGCMHFKCNQCPDEFCSGCNDLFKQVFSRALL